MFFYAIKICYNYIKFLIIWRNLLEISARTSLVDEGIVYRNIQRMLSKIILKSKINIVTEILSEKEFYVWNSRLCRT